MDFEDILSQVGDEGTFQKRLFAYFILIVPLISWFDMNILFILSVPDHWCNVPELAASNLSIEQQKLLISPKNDPKCQMYDVNYSSIIKSGMYEAPGNTTTTQCDNGWQYDKTNYDYTAATQWNMYCKDDYYPSLVITLYNVGSIIVTPIYGCLADRFGRKITFLIVIIVTTVTSVASVLVTNLTAFVVLKSINGSVLPSIYQLPFVIVLELFSAKMRTHMNGFACVIWAIGLCFLSLVAYLSRNWITLGLVVSSVNLVIFLFWIYLPESPRWLISQGYCERAAVIIKKIADVNNKTVDKDELLLKLQILSQKENEERTRKSETSFLDLLKYPQLRKIFLIITSCWVAIFVAYYGVQLNVFNLSGNEFINFFLISLMEIPGSLVGWTIMYRYGRKWSTTGGFIVLGISCILSTINYAYADVICSMVGKLSGAVLYVSVYQQSSELFPTVIRSTGMAVSRTIGTLAMIGVPYVVYLSTYGKSIPFIIMGCVALSAGVLAALLPESLNRNLPETIADCEEFGKKYNTLFPKRKRSSSRNVQCVSLEGL